MTDATIRVEVAYASPERQALRTLTLPEGASAADALRASGLAEEFPEIDPATAALAVYGKRVRPEAPLRDRDRVEIVRPLQIDPKESRRTRAKRRAGR